MEKCELHKTELEDGFASISYGLIHFPDKDFETKSKLFPNANTSVHGGCVIEEKSRTEVKFCPLCRKAEEDWDKRR